MFEVDGDGMMLEGRILQSGDAFFHQWVCGRKEKKKKKDRLTVNGTYYNYQKLLTIQSTVSIMTSHGE